MALVIEVLIALSLVSAEILAQHSRKAAKAAGKVPEAATALPDLPVTISGDEMIDPKFGS